MSRTPYDYARREGVEEIGWERFQELTARLAERLARFEIDLVVGVSRGGLFPATEVALALRRTLVPVGLSRRVDDVVRFDSPVWRVDVPGDVAGKRVAVVDDIADTGETIALVASRVRERGGAHVVTATLAAHTWSAPAPDVTALVTDALVLFPWGRRVHVDGEWRAHPELAEALRQQQP